MFRDIWYRIGKILVSLVARGFLELSVERRAPLPKGPFILAANHPSTIDPALITILTDQKISILIRDALFKVPVFGRSLRFCGHIPVVQGQGQQSMDEALNLLRSGQSIAIFPEGEISPEHGFHKPHTGLARLALASGAPVIPIGLYLDHKQLRLTTSRLDGQVEIGTWYMNGGYAITVGEAQTFHGNCEDRALVRQVSDEMMDRIASLAFASARRILTRRRMNWLRTTRWYLWSPVRLVRSWSAFQGVKTY